MWPMWKMRRPGWVAGVCVDFAELIVSQAGIHYDSRPAAPEKAAAGDDSPEVLPYEAEPVDPSDDEPTNLRAKFIRGSFWSGGGYFLQTAIRLGGSLILTRLLAPDLFGIVAIVNIVAQGLEMFSDIGIGPSIIQNKRGNTRAFLDTAFTLQAIRGFVLFLVSCAVAYPISVSYDQPILLALIPVAALNALFRGFQHTSIFTENRALRLGWITGLQIVAQAIGLVATIAYALIWRQMGWELTAWALVLPGLLGTICYVAGSHFLPGSDGRRFRLDADARHELVSFGKWIFLSTILTFLATQGDRLMLSVILDEEDRWTVIGIFGIALMMATMPMMVLQRIGASAVFPAFSRVQDDPERFRNVFGRVRQTLLMLGAFASAGFIAGGTPLIETLYDSRYHDAGWILQALAVSAWFQIMWTPTNAALLSRGQSKWLAIANGGKLVALIAGLGGGYLLGREWALITPLQGAIGGIVVSEVARYVIFVVAAKLNRLPGLGQDVVYTIGMSAAAFLAWGAMRLFDETVVDYPAIDLLVVFVASILLWAGPVLWQLKRQKTATEF